MKEPGLETTWNESVTVGGGSLPAGATHMRVSKRLSASNAYKRRAGPGHELATSCDKASFDMCRPVVHGEPWCCLI